MATNENVETRTSHKVVFNNETMLNFIEFYQKHECLWNIRLKDYKKHDKRKIAIAEIAVEMGVSEDFVKKKIRSFAVHIYTGKKKINESKCTGTGTDDVYTPSLFWYHKLDFLQNVIVPRKTTSNLNNNTQFQISKEKLASLCAECERYIGTQGGGMDQAIAFLATEGCAKHIEFSPLRSHDVTLPSKAIFVIAHSLTSMNKAATADFNCRVVECRLATQVK
ncbi:unnamed protein product [Diabrotica balteata]|uniref:MADF domain-containing protein n=1 Tax=Diabrotica balteata TaxID=107213 RepID=A0A9N9TF09_DIABA|nr:unnamed protein product [Diabrotica balteata]